MPSFYQYEDHGNNVYETNVYEMISFLKTIGYYNYWGSCWVCGQKQYVSEEEDFRCCNCDKELIYEDWLIAVKEYNEEE